MAVVTWRLATQVMVDVPSAAIASVAAAASLLLDLNVAWLIAGGAVAGYLLSLLR